MMSKVKWIEVPVTNGYARVGEDSSEINLNMGNGVRVPTKEIAIISFFNEMMDFAHKETIKQGNTRAYIEFRFEVWNYTVTANRGNLDWVFQCWKRGDSLCCANDTFHFITQIKQLAKEGVFNS